MKPPLVTVTVENVHYYVDGMRQPGGFDLRVITRTDRRRVETEEHADTLAGALRHIRKAFKG